MKNMTEKVDFCSFNSLRSKEVVRHGRDTFREGRGAVNHGRDVLDDEFPLNIWKAFLEINEIVTRRAADVDDEGV